MLLSRSPAVARPTSLKTSHRPLGCVHRLRPLAAAGNGDKAEGSKPRRRSSSKNSSDADIPPPAVQLANSMSTGRATSGPKPTSGSGSGSGKGGGSGNTPPPAVQIANNMASSGSSSSSGAKGSSSGGSGGSGSTPSPAVQVANNLSTGSSTTPASPAAQVASNMANTQQGTPPPAGSSSNRGSSAGDFNPADLLQQGVRAAADTAENALINTASAAVGGIEAASSLTQSGINAAEGAAEDTMRNLEAAAQGTLNAAAATAGGAVGVVDGVGQALAGGSSMNGNRGAPGAISSGDFETVNVRVPATAWANATPEKGRVRDNTLTQDFDEDEVEQYKVQILAAVASLDRGLAANVREARDVDRLARKLEDAAGPITLKWTTSRSSPNKSTMDRLAGTWRLIYSSGFNGGSLGGSRPGPQIAFVPTILGQVYQVINAQMMTLDNVVELLLNYGVPQLPFLPRPEPQPSPGLRLSLHHTYEVTPPSTVRIVFESTSAKAIGPDILQGLPELGVPELPSFLKPPTSFRSATFDVSYLDQSMRITRGDRGELRICLRDRPLNALLPMDDSDRDYE